MDPSFPDAKLRRATVSDVAERAQVSTSTVSRALSGARKVDPTLRLRVIAAAQELGYRPNHIAKALRVQATQTVGFVVPDLTNPYFPLLIEALENHLRAHEVSLLLTNSANDIRREEAAIESLLDRNVDAIFVSPCNRDRSADALVKANAHVPIIQVDRFASAELPYVGTDHTAAIGQLVDIQSKRFSELGFIGANRDEWPYYNRELAYRAATTGASSQRVLPAVDTIAAGKAVGVELPKIWPGVRGIICANDQVAFGCLEALRTKYPEIAEEYEITGFDNTVIAEAGQLTSVQQPIEQITARAVELMLDPSTRDADAPAFVEFEAAIVRHRGDDQ